MKTLWSLILILLTINHPTICQEFMDLVEEARKMDEHMHELFAHIRLNAKGSVKTDDYVVGDKEAHAKRFRKISDDLKRIEDGYIECLNYLTDKNFSEDTIDACVGKDLIKINNDIAYFKNKLYAKIDGHIRADFIELCYDIAEDEIMLQSCDLFEKDMLDVLWAELNIFKVADINRQRYLINVGTLPEEMFENLLARFKPLYEEFGDLLQEIRDHQLSIIESVKTNIDDRSKIILIKANESGGYTPLPKFISHTVEITQTLSQDPIPNVHRLPAILMDGSTKLYADQFDSNGRRQVYTPDNFEYLAEGPSVVIPIRKLEKRMEALRNKLKQKNRAA